MLMWRDAGSASIGIMLRYSKFRADLDGPQGGCLPGGQSHRKKALVFWA